MRSERGGRGPAGLALALGLAALAGGGACGHYTAPVRPPPLGPDQGPVYDAGQPAQPEDDEEDGG